MSDLLRRQQRAIRAVAERARDHAGWAEACALLDELPDETVRAHAAELEIELAAWPPQLRVAPRAGRRGSGPRGGSHVCSSVACSTCP